MGDETRGCSTELIDRTIFWMTKQSFLVPVSERMSAASDDAKLAIIVQAGLCWLYIATRKRPEVLRHD